MAAVTQIEAAVVSSANRKTFLENHSRAEKTDAGHDPLCHARLVRSNRVVVKRRHPLA